MGLWYTTGTITLTAASAAVTGTGTAWTPDELTGGIIVVNGAIIGEVGTVNSATSITMAAPSGISGTYSYAIVQYAGPLLAKNAYLLNQIRIDYQAVKDGPGAGKFGDGSAAAPGIRFANDLDTGFSRPADNTIGVVTGGVQRATWSSGGLSLVGDLSFDQARTITANQANGDFRLTNPADAGLLSLNVGTTAGFTSGVRIFGGGYTDPSVVTLYTASQERLRVTPQGNVGIGTSAPSNTAGYTKQLQIEGTFPVLTLKDTTSRSYSLGVSSGKFQLWDNTASAYRFTIDQSGNFLVGSTSGNSHVFSKPGAAGSSILQIDNLSLTTAVFFAADGSDGSGTACGLRVRASNTTSRAINVGGTINTGGADYAEYKTKAPGCGVIAKGDVCGINAEGQLVTRWADMVAPRLKSTNPNLVGADTWADETAIGPKPIEPILALPRYEGPPQPEPVPPLPSAPPEPGPAPLAPAEPVRAEGEGDIAWAQRVNAYVVDHAEWLRLAGLHSAAAAAYPDLLAAYEAAAAEHEEAVAAFVDAEAAHEAARSQWEAEVAAAEAAHEDAHAAYEADLATWEAALETARVKVDRIAYCGDVPVNFAGECEPGDYLVAVQDGDGIGLARMTPAEMTADLASGGGAYLRRVGRVVGFEPDGGRPIIDVQHG